MLKVKDWSKFQHFKDRKPPWIKLYRDVLDDLQWHELSGDDAKTLVMIWLIASESDGQLPTVKELAFRLRVSEKSMKSSVSKLGHWLIQDDIKPISDITAISPRYQNDALETETETETETEAETETPVGFVLPEWVNKKHWDIWHQSPKRRKATADQKQLAVDKLSAWRDDGLDHAGALENAAVGGNQGLFLPSGGNKRPRESETAYQRTMREKWETATGRNKALEAVNGNARLLG